MAAPFSRLQLAAALIEYDNDPDNPDAPHRSARESAIFAHFRRNPAARPELASRNSNHLGVSLPTDNGTQSGRDSQIDTRRSRGSRGSLDALRNPFGADGNSDYDDDGQEHEPPDMEVDLSSWGLDAFIPKEKGKKGKEKQAHAPTLAAVRSRTISDGPHEFGGHVDNPGSQSRSLSSLANKRQSTSSRLDYTEDAANTTLQRRRAGSQSTFPANAHAPDAVPFPSTRSQSPGYDLIGSPQRPLEGVDVEDDDGRHRRLSRGTIGTLQPPDDNPFALQPPSHTSRFDPKAAAVHARTYSSASMGSRLLLENDGASVRTRDSSHRDRPYSVVELLRPKVLVMPSPLQPVGPDPNADNVRSGFQLSQDGPPLPPGARSSRRISMNMDSVPIASNSFTPNPSADLSLAQKIFRNTLAVGDQSGLYQDSEGILPRATNDGEQIEFEAPPVEEDPRFHGADPSAALRPAGKLFGKSLIDDLETRKAQMRSKQRVFTGDQRPSMMAREGPRASTFIDPATLHDLPKNPRQSAYGLQGPQTGLNRRNSRNAKPLLTFDEDDGMKLQPKSPHQGRIPKDRSVFGVDVLWEQEMARLREMEEEERVAEKTQAKLEEEEERRKTEKQKKKKKQKKLKKKGLEEPEEIPEPIDSEQVVVASHVPEMPPTLPAIKPAIVRRTVPQVPDDESSTESEDEDNVPPRGEATVAWHSDSEDEKPKSGPLRTTGVGLRNPAQPMRMPLPRGSDSEEDLPLSTAMRLAASRNTGLLAAANDSEDEDRPLSHVLQASKSKSKSPILDVNFDNFRPSNEPDSDGEDSQPLGLRASRLVLNRTGQNDDDDDKPLAFHPDQQRRTQYQLLAAQQQHNMMMQTQFQNNMFFNSPMIPAPFFAPPMMNPMAMMQPPMPIPSPAPIHDENKFLSVDRWRRDVAVDGDR